MAYVREHREGAAPFDVVITGPTVPRSDGAELVARYVEAGLTWWLEGCHHRRGTLADTIARIKGWPAATAVDVELPDHLLEQARDRRHGDRLRREVHFHERRRHERHKMLASIRRCDRKEASFAPV